MKNVFTDITPNKQLIKYNLFVLIAFKVNDVYTARHSVGQKNRVL